jgi:hypothetical protein
LNIEKQLGQERRGKKYDVRSMKLVIRNRLEKEKGMK